MVSISKSQLNPSNTTPIDWKFELDHYQEIISSSHCNALPNQIPLKVLHHHPVSVIRRE